MGKNGYLLLGVLRCWICLWWWIDYNHLLVWGTDLVLQKFICTFKIRVITDDALIGSYCLISAILVTEENESFVTSCACNSRIYDLELRDELGRLIMPSVIQRKTFPREWPQCNLTSFILIMQALRIIIFSHWSLRHNVLEVVLMPFNLDIAGTWYDVVVTSKHLRILIPPTH